MTTPKAIGSTAIRVVQFGAVLLWLAAAPDVSGQCHYDVTIIQGPTHPVYGPPATVATGVNNLGHVVGYYFYVDDARGFLWTPHGGFQTLPMPPGALTCSPSGINDAGMIVGTIETTSGFRGFVYDQGLCTLLEPMLGVGWSAAAGINNAGQVIGYRSIGGGVNPYNAYIWTAGVFTALGVMTGPNSQAMAINDSGDVTGWSGSNPINSIAFRRVAGVVELLPGAGDFRSSYGLGINSSGAVVGAVTYYSDSQLTSRGFSWMGSQVSLLAPLEGYDRCTAIGVDDLGRVAGVSTLAAEPNNRNGTVWIQSLPADIDEFGPLEQELSVQTIYGMRADGAIAGSGHLLPGRSLVGYWIVPACVPTDLDGDGVVDVADLALLLSNFGCTDTACRGDVDGNGATDLNDLVQLLSNFGI